MEKNWLLPDINNPVTKEFWQGCAEGELRLQRCKNCGKTRMPPREMCPHCRSLENEWIVTSGEGKIWSFVVAHPPLLPAFNDLAPYPVVTVELKEDPKIRFVGNLVTSVDGAVNEIDPATIQVGDPVRVVFTQVNDTFLPRWVPTK